MTVHFLQLTLPGGKPVMINVAQVVSIAAATFPKGKTSIKVIGGCIVVDETLEDISLAVVVASA